jgi:hypothetical protein
MSQHKEQRGFLTFAKNSDNTDYLRLAYAQALNIKHTQNINRFAVVVDSKTHELVTDEHLKVFNYVIVHDSIGPFDAEAMAFWLTPFKETIKLESDLLFTRSIDHWWHAFRLRDIVLSTGCRDYEQNTSNNRKYRKVFDTNNLPDVYNGLMYFRFSQTARDFFVTARQLFEQWDSVQAELKQCDQQPSTDLIFAIAAEVVGRDQCTIPTMDYINFVHMKPDINRIPETASFTDVFTTVFDEGMIRINSINQYHPLHYYDKNFITDEMIEYYARSHAARSTATN